MVPGNYSAKADCCFGLIAVYINSMMYTEKQWKWLARVVHGAKHLVQTVEPGVHGTGEAKILLGMHRRDDGSRVKLWLTAELEAPDHPAVTHGMKPPVSK